jgi:hypothetical protein
MRSRGRSVPLRLTVASTRLAPGSAGEFVDEEVIADLEVRDHRSGGNPERLQRQRAERIRLDAKREQHAGPERADLPSLWGAAARPKRLRPHLVAAEPQSKYRGHLDRVGLLGRACVAPP